MDITEEYNKNKDIWLAEVKLQNLLREAFPEQRFWVEFRGEDAIIIKDCHRQKIIITGDTEEPHLILEAEGDSHILKQAATYLLSTLEVQNTPMRELEELLFGGKNYD